MACDVCGNRDRLRAHAAREMMFGWRHRFDYLECADCGCLRIVEIPEALASYYPSEYYAFANDEAATGLARSLFRRRDAYAYRRRGTVGRLLNAVAGNPALESIRLLSPQRDARILDVGCGAGTLLRSLHALGFTRVEGIDPINRHDVTTPEGIRIRKAALSDVGGSWDLIMLHHVFEHLPDSRGTLEHIRRRLADAGSCIIRTPLAGSHAWTHYGVDWVQLDAPRHVRVHSVASLNRLAEQTGLTVERIVYDSTSFQFWGSELYRRGVSLEAARGFAFFRAFSLGQIRDWERQAQTLNAEGKGDQAAFYLRKVPSA